MYNFTIEQCDIEDKENLEIFRERRASWIESFNGKDTHAILTQFYEMMWRDTFFRTINEIRKEKNNNVTGFNYDVLRMFDAGYATMQAVTIRRITDKPKNNPDLAVNSLKSTIKDIKSNIHLFTRENYISYDGLPYDYMSVHDEWLRKKVEIGNTDTIEWMDTTGPKAWGMSEIVHKHFDKISGISSEERNRNDTLSSDWLDGVEKELNVCNDVRKYVDKFIAHAAAPETRKSISEKDKVLTLDNLEKCYKAIFTVISKVYNQFLYESDISPLATPQYDIFENLDKSWLSSSDFEKINEIWNKREEELEGWNQ